MNVCLGEAPHNLSYKHKLLVLSVHWRGFLFGGFSGGSTHASGFSGTPSFEYNHHNDLPAVKQYLDLHSIRQEKIASR